MKCCTPDCEHETQRLYCEECIAKRAMPKDALLFPELPELQPVVERDEANVQRHSIELLRARGWRVWRIGQHNAKSTQDAGVPDTLNVLTRAQLAVWIEYKAPDGSKLSAAQADFREHVIRTGGRYWLVHSRAELIGHLAELGQ